jgi:hypothetical protein
MEETSLRNPCVVAKEADSKWADTHLSNGAVLRVRLNVYSAPYPSRMTGM